VQDRRQRRGCNDRCHAVLLRAVRIDRALHCDERGRCLGRSEIGATCIGQDHGDSLLGAERWVANLEHAIHEVSRPKQLPGLGRAALSPRREQHLLL
jgi:hypothetical protein